MDFNNGKRESYRVTRPYHIQSTGGLPALSVPNCRVQRAARGVSVLLRRCSSSQTPNVLSIRSGSSHGRPQNACRIHKWLSFRWFGPQWVQVIELFVGKYSHVHTVSEMCWKKFGTSCHLIGAQHQRQFILHRFPIWWRKNSLFLLFGIFWFTTVSEDDLGYLLGDARRSKKEQNPSVVMDMTP